MERDGIISGGAPAGAPAGFPQSGKLVSFSHLITTRDAVLSFSRVGTAQTWLLQNWSASSSPPLTDPFIA